MVRLILAIAFNQERIADYTTENCHPSARMNGCNIANNIRNVALQFGTVLTFKAYMDMSLESARANGFQTQLQASGVSMIHCPHASMKEVVDRALTGKSACLI